MEALSCSLKEPRKKKCRVDAIGAELPILSENKKKVCKGIWAAGMVMVRDWEDIKHLYCNVSFFVFKSSMKSFF